MLKEVLSGAKKKVPGGNRNLYTQRMKITGNSNHVGKYILFF